MKECKPNSATTTRAPCPSSTSVLVGAAFYTCRCGTWNSLQILFLSAGLLKDNN